MKCSFVNWYSQALGATLGIFACIYAYLNGFMFVYTNISNNFDFMRWNNIVSSYLLLPLCLITFLCGVVRSTLTKETCCGISFDYLNKTIAIITIIIGFLGAKVYFIIPSILISMSFYSFNKSSKNNINDSLCDEYTTNDNNTNIYHKNTKKADDSKSLSTRIEIALNLLSKNSNKDFIMEITGLSIEEIESLEKKLHI